MNGQDKHPGAVETILTPSQVKRLGQWAPSRQGRLKRLFLGVSKSRKQAIQFQCLDCTGEDTKAITHCGDRCCPLWHFRPFQP